MSKPEKFEVESPILQIVLESFLAKPDAEFVVTRTLRPYVEFAVAARQMDICRRENLRERGLRDVRLDVRIDDAASELAFAQRCLERRREIIRVASEKGATPNPDTLLSELSEAARTLGFMLDMREKNSPPVNGAVTLKGPKRPRRQRRRK